MHSDKFSQISTFISVYGVAHLIVDAACAFLLLGVLNLHDNVILSMLVYNAFAFVLQAPLGFIIDKVLNPKLAAIVGLCFIAISFLFWKNIYVALFLASTGNALYHVGGGSLVLSLKEKKATFAGIYVAPGGIGLALGTFLAYSQFAIHPLIFSFTLLILVLFICFVNTPRFNRTVVKKNGAKFSISVLIIVLVMIPVAVRSLIGLSTEFPWKVNQNLYVVLIAALALGKVFGGILADKYGLMKVGVGGLLISAPLLAFYTSYPILGIFGAFTLNFTMPVTLIAIFNVIPKYKGLSFGLTTAAIFFGALPAIIGRNAWIKSENIVFSSILIASTVLFTALYLKNSFKTLKV